MIAFKNSESIELLKRARNIVRCGLGLWLCVALSIGTIVFASEKSSEDQPVVVNQAETEKINISRLDCRYLPNAIQLHRKVICGGLPADRDAFSELKKLGVQSIISVDGQLPDVEMASDFAMKYVHLPHGYSGISPQRIAELAKGVLELPGPIYIHCHHGKHRSPAAASAACVAAGLVPEQDAVSILRLAGTSLHYEGLYRSVAAASPMDREQLKKLTVQFQERAETAPLVESMVSIENIFSALKQFQENNWKKLEDHPDLSPAHQALLLKEHFRETRRSEVSLRSQDYLGLMKSSETAAGGLESVIRQLQTSKSLEFVQPLAAELMSRLEQNCQRCHREYRDRPIGDTVQ